MYEFKEFPKWIYHKDKSIKARLVHTREEQDMWGEDWKESPADHETVEPEFSLENASLEELTKIALENGISKKKLKELKKEQLIVLLKGES